MAEPVRGTRSGRLVAGVDSSTQSTKVLLCRADNGEVVARGSAPHPPGTERHPHHWWTALQQAGNGLLEQAAAIAIAGQQAGRGVGFQHALLIGGGARSAAIREIAPGIFGRDVEVPEPAEYVALGAARQAAWALADTPQPPDWPRPAARRYAGQPQPELRTRYAALRNATVGWS